MRIEKGDEMKAIIATVIVGTMIVLLCSAAMAETAAKSEYVVQSGGDWLIKIGQKTKTSWKQIAKVNNLAKPYIIYPGQKLIIPENKWEKVGGNPYKGTWQWAIDNFDLPVEVKKQIRENIENNNFKWLKGGLKGSQKVSQVTFGKNEIWTDVICYWSENRSYAAKDYGDNKYVVIHVLWCNNWAWWSRKKLPELSPEPILKPKEKAEFPVAPIFIEKKEEIPIKKDEFEFFMGSGIYESVHYDAQGYYLWGKARYLPFRTAIFPQTDLKLGIFGFASYWDGHNENYKYQGKKFLFGPTIKMVSPYCNMDFDFGFGKRFDEGGNSLYQSEQEDSLFSFSVNGDFYNRRKKEEKLFPQLVIGFELDLPYQSRHNHNYAGNLLESNPTDNRRFELSARPMFYDFNLGDLDAENYFRLTPGMNLAVGHEYSSDETYTRFGPTTTLGISGRDILSLSFLNFSFSDSKGSEQWHWLSGWVNVGELIKFIGALQIKEPEPRDLIFNK